MVQTCSAKQISYESHMNNPAFASFTKTTKKCSGVQRTKTVRFFFGFSRSFCSSKKKIKETGLLRKI